MVDLKHFNGQTGFSSTFYLCDMNKSSAISFYNTVFNQDVEILALKQDIETITPIRQLHKRYYISYDNQLIIDLDCCPYPLVEDDCNKIKNLSCWFTDKFNFLNLYETVLKKYIKQENINFPKFNLISKTDNGFGTIKRTLKTQIKIDLINSYNVNFSLNKVQEMLSDEKSGLILFSGNPGTGKSYLIKYFTQVLSNKSFFYLPNTSLWLLSEPSFLNYCLNNMQDSILVLEDCELALKSRNQGGGNDVSTILNITDGIIGDIMNIKVIATLNTTDKIDTALLRKGRMLANCEFKPLTIEQANNTAKLLNKNINIINETCLCDIYNAEDNGVIENRVKLGF